MKNYESIVKHVIESIEVVYEGADDADKGEYTNALEGGMWLIMNAFRDSLNPRESDEITFDKFIRFNHCCLTFEYDYQRMERLLESWGIESDKYGDVDTTYHMTIYPVFKMICDDFEEE